MSVNARAGQEPSIGELVSNVTGNVSSLVRLEIELAKTELQEQVRQAGQGGGMAAAAGFLAYLATILLSFAAVYGLAVVMPVWAAFLVVAGVYLLVAAVLGFVGMRKFRALRGPQKAQLQAQLTKDKLAGDAATRAEAKAAGLTVDELNRLRQAEAAQTVGGVLASAANGEVLRRPPE